MDDPSQNLSWLIPGAHQDRPSITPQWLPCFDRPIEGVQLVPVRAVTTGYGRLIEMLRAEWLDGGAIDQIFTSLIRPGMVSAWHAHGFTTDRLFVAAGQARIVLYDARPTSSSFGAINEFRLGPSSPGLVMIPPRVWHGVQADSDEPAILINAVDRAYNYSDPDHWRVPADSPDIPFRFPF